MQEKIFKFGHVAEKWDLQNINCNNIQSKYNSNEIKVSVFLSHLLAVLSILIIINNHTGFSCT